MGFRAGPYFFGCVIIQETMHIFLGVVFVCFRFDFWHVFRLSGIFPMVVFVIFWTCETEKQKKYLNYDEKTLVVGWEKQRPRESIGFS